MLLLNSLMLVGLSFGQTPQPVQPFPDVPKTHWAYAAVTELHEKGILKGYPGKYDRSTPQAAFQSLLKAIHNGDEASMRELMSSQLIESLHISSLNSQKRMAVLKQAGFEWKVRAVNLSPGAWEAFNAKAAAAPLGTEMEIRYFKGHDVVFRFVQDPSGWKFVDFALQY